MFISVLHLILIQPGDVSKLSTLSGKKHGTMAIQDTAQAIPGSGNWMGNFRQFFHEGDPPVSKHSYGKSPFIVDLPTENCDFP